jgi:hypothetical protein
MDWRFSLERSVRWFFEQKLGGACLCITTISPMRELVYGMLKRDDLMYDIKSRMIRLSYPIV